MKKIFCVLLVLLSLCSCKKTEDFDHNYKLDTYIPDMSGYNGLTSVNHCFLGTTVSELNRLMNEKGSGAFVLSRIGCDHCQLGMKYINKAGQDLGVNIYYIDAESSRYPIVGTDNYDILDKILKPIEEELDGEIALQTPHFFTVINGNFIDSYIGVSFKDNDNPTDKEIKDLINKYSKALKPFVK